VDTYGVPVAYRVASLHDVENPSEELSSKIRQMIFDGAIRGHTYEAQFEPLPQQRMFVRFSQQIGAMDDRALMVFAVQGQIITGDRVGPLPPTRIDLLPPPPKGELAWINVRPAFSPLVMGRGDETAQIAPDGSCSLYGTHGGLCLVTVYQGAKILKTAVTDIPFFAPSKPIQIELQ